MLPPFEKLGAFYLGREVDPSTGADRPDLLLYDSRDLTTHAVCVGMTGSGKTGLCLSLLEEAAIDGVPAIVIDPKGDLGNLLLTFPELRPEDFLPWIDPGEAARKQMTPESYAAKTAQTWREGLAQWDQDGARIQRLHDAVEISIYTPGDEAGRPLSILRSFSAPPTELRADAGALRERIASTVAGLLGLVGVEADPIKSREHILLSSLVDQAWRAGRDLDLAAIIQGVQKPPFDRVGVLDLETFYPAKDRLQLAMTLNNILAAPGFAAWMHGDPLDAQRLLFTKEGKPRISIISIAHLNDAERMFVVTLVLGEIIAWMRRQTGASSLRALLYMDEIFGYFPPVAMPPSKAPLLTLMKQARAYGLGVVLATQNPVDLDYKGLSNAGTWLIGRLQTERDRARVIDGMLSASSDGLDKAQLEALMTNLGNRVFLMRNVHDDAPVLFRTRWAMSYLRGPMTLQEIARLTPAAASAPRTTQEGPTKAHDNAVGDHQSAQSAGRSEPLSIPHPLAAASKPVVPAGVAEYYLPSQEPASTLQPRIVGVARVHFVNKAAGIDVWETRSWLAQLDDNETPDWSAELKGDITAAALSAPGDAAYAQTPSALLRPSNYKAWSKDLSSHIYRSATFTVFRCPAVREATAPATDEGEFRSHIALKLHERRDQEIDRLRKKYAARVSTLENQIARASERIERERAQLSQQKFQTAITVGTSILGALLGRKRISATNAGRVGTAARSAGRIGRESDDVGRAEQSLETLERRLSDLQLELESEAAQLQTDFDPQTVVVERDELKPRKADIEVTIAALAWLV